MRLLICAGRHYADTLMCLRVLDAYQAINGVSVLIHGASPYLGSAGEDWAREAGVDVVRYPPNWKMFGKQAERRRNQFMLTDSRPDVVIALPGGDDTCALISRARAAGIHVVTVNN